MKNTNHPLFDSVALDSIECSNRMVMAPMTRNRADDFNAPTSLNAEYYQQRTSAGLIVTEATQVSPQGQGYPRTPGIHSDQQVEGWNQVTEAVHEAGGRIFLQLWHVGRISHSDYHDGEQPVAPSAVKPEGTVLTPSLEEVPFETPRPLETEEIPKIVNDFKKGASNARKAGFDGVEIHSANGYLIDQFLRSHTNQRDDQYGGSISNRLRFLEEITEAVTEVWSADRVGVRFSPLSEFNDIRDETPVKTFPRAAERMDDFSLGYMHLVEPAEPKPPVRDSGVIGETYSALREAYNGPIMANGNYNLDSAAEAMEDEYAQLISFGRSFLANPDLPQRLEQGLPLNKPDDETFYNGDETGYTDYPTWEEIQEQDLNVPTIPSLEELPARNA